VNPFPLVLSSPSGGGKTTISRMLLEERSDVGYSVSCTTREPRHGEENGRDYFFLSREDFLARRSRGDFAETAEVHGHLYGTLRSEIDRVLSGGQHVVMDIDVQGARRVASAYLESVLVFLLPPSAELLVQRLAARGTESGADFLRRMKNARTELLAMGSYHYVVVNDDLSRTFRTVCSIVDAEVVRHRRQPLLDTQVRQLVADLDREILSLTQTV
jgi:guanylate kinase